MGLFEIKRPTKAQDLAVAHRANKQQTVTAIRSGNSLLSIMNRAKAIVEQNLGKYKDQYAIIQTESDLEAYVRHCKDNGTFAIDTETTGLDPLLDKIVGLSMFTPGDKAIYVPINHISYITGERVSDQLPVEIIARWLNQLNGLEIDMFNAKFDQRVLKNQAGIILTCTWDASIAARLLNENEKENKLKALHKKYVLQGKEDEFSFGEIFKGITFDKVPISTGYIYAAHDAIITKEYADYQRPFLTPGNEQCEKHGLRDVAWVFHNIEMPVLQVVADMEDYGVDFDFDKNAELAVKYHKLLDEALINFQNEVAKYQDKIDAFRQKNPNVKIDDPINVGSPQQIAVLLYDIIKLPQPIDKRTKKPARGTGEEVLSEMDNPVAKAILKFREMDKLVSTYIDKLPNCVNPNDGRIHCNFNQIGADTGRFSSDNPNLQNIPSHNKDIRQMFKATDGYVMMSADYSQQEPKVMTQMCGDPGMIKAYQEGKDLYSEIAAISFNRSYEDCLEFYLDENGHKTDKTNVEGKNYRSQAKSILLGTLYGRGVASIAEQLHTTTDKAQDIQNKVFKGFPAIKQFEKDSVHMAEDNGFVTTLWGRKRRLPAMQLPDYEFKWSDEHQAGSDPLDFDDVEEEEIPQETIEKYLRLLNRSRFGGKKKIFEQANKEGIWIIDNTKKIADATRQCVNSRIQGSAADMTKLAMILIGNDPQLKEWGFHIMIPVHDELIGECPEENREKVEKRFAELMSKAPGAKLTIPISCDVAVTKCWYGEEL